MPDPVQLLPPCAGAGLVHVLVLDFVPVPQVLEHDEYDVYVVHPPFTKSTNFNPCSKQFNSKKEVHFLDWNAHYLGMDLCCSFVFLCHCLYSCSHHVGVQDLYTFLFVFGYQYHRLQGMMTKIHKHSMLH